MTRDLGGGDPLSLQYFVPETLASIPMNYVRPLHSSHPIRRGLAVVLIALCGAVSPARPAPSEPNGRDAPKANREHDAKNAPKDAPKAPPSTAPATPEAAPEKDGEFIEYRYLPELGQIIFTDNSVRGAKRVAYLKDHADELAKKGIYACSDESKRHVYRQSQAVGERKIESAVVIDPPTHEGDDGDYFTARLLVKVDGRKKIDCTIGTTADGELWVNKVVIHPEDGTVEIRALSGDGEELGIPESQESLDNPAVITDNSFYEDDPAEPGKGPVKA